MYTPPDNIIGKWDLSKNLQYEKLDVGLQNSFVVNQSVYASEIIIKLLLARDSES